MTEQEFLKLAEEHGLVLSMETIDKLNIYQRLLEEKNKVMNLTGIDQKEDVYEKHFYDSLLFSFNEDMNGKSLIDVGTGAGFPGLVLAICYPNLKVTLLEPLTKRCNFLEEVVKELRLTNVEIVNERSEDYSIKNVEKYDYAVARAVSKLNILLEIISPLVKINGLFVALKGKIYQEEILESKNALKTLIMEVIKVKEEKLPSENDIRGNIFIQKKGKTPSKFPRNYGQIKKRPL